MHGENLKLMEISLFSDINEIHLGSTELTDCWVQLSLIPNVYDYYSNRGLKNISGIYKSPQNSRR